MFVVETADACVLRSTCLWRL